jgi:hypothetical protein
LTVLCSAFSEIADHIYSQVPFAAGVMGEEASGCWRRPTPAREKKAHQAYPPLALLNADVIEKRGAFVVCPDLWAELACNSRATALPSGLLYAPPQPNTPLIGA